MRSSSSSFQHGGYRPYSVFLSCSMEVIVPGVVNHWFHTRVGRALRRWVGLVREIARVQEPGALGRKTRSAFFTPILASAFFTRSLRVFYVILRLSLLAHCARFFTPIRHHVFLPRFFRVFLKRVFFFPSRGDRASPGVYVNLAIWRFPPEREVPSGAWLKPTRPSYARVC